MNHTPIRRFYKDEEELGKIQQDLKQTQCPHCGQYGSLIFNGTARGYIEGEELMVVRRQRVICNARRKHGCGCGGCFSLYKAEIIPELRVLAGTLWLFALTLLSSLSVKAVWILHNFEHDRRAFYRWRAMLQRRHGQWRSRLCTLSKQPELPSHKESKPLVVTLEHLKKCFDSRPFSSYQHHFQASLF